MDNCFVKHSHFCLPGLDNSFRRVWSSPISQFTISFPLVQGSSRVLHNLTHIFWMCVLPTLGVSRVMILLETGHINSFFSRSMPRVIFLFVTSFQMPNFTAYKQQNSFPTLHIFEIFLLGILSSSASSISVFLVVSPHPSKARYSLHPLQVFLRISKCLRLCFLRLAIVQIKLQTSIMTPLATLIIVAIVVVAVVIVGIPPRNTRLVSLGFPQRSSKNNLGQGQPQGLRLIPRQAFLRPFLQTRQRLYIAVLQVFHPRRLRFSKVRFSNFEFYNKLLGGVTLSNVTLGVI